jgi:hypothetical protein
VHVAEAADVQADDSGEPAGPESLLGVQHQPDFRQM